MNYVNRFTYVVALLPSTHNVKGTGLRETSILQRLGEIEINTWNKGLCFKTTPHFYLNFFLSIYLSMFKLFFLQIIKNIYLYSVSQLARVARTFSSISGTTGPCSRLEEQDRRRCEKPSGQL